MDNTALIIATLGFVASVIGTLLLARYQLSRAPAQDDADRSQANLNKTNALKLVQEMLDQRAEELQQKEDARKVEMQEVRSELTKALQRLAEVEQQQLAGDPFQIVISGRTRPRPEIIQAEILIKPMEKVNGK